jgi:hypothetical protein
MDEQMKSFGLLLLSLAFIFLLVIGTNVPVSAQYGQPTIPVPPPSLPPPGFGEEVVYVEPIFRGQILGDATEGTTSGQILGTRRGQVLGDATEMPVSGSVLMTTLVGGGAALLITLGVKFRPKKD